MHYISSNPYFHSLALISLSAVIAGTALFLALMCGIFHRSVTLARHLGFLAEFFWDTAIIVAMASLGSAILVLLIGGDINAH